MTPEQKRLGNARRMCVQRFADRLSANTGMHFALVGRGDAYSARFHNGAVVAAVTDNGQTFRPVFSLRDKHAEDIATATSIMKGKS